jgi:hypothetical protein
LLFLSSLLLALALLACSHPCNLYFRLSSTHDHHLWLLGKECSVHGGKGL